MAGPSYCSAGARAVFDRVLDRKTRILKGFRRLAETGKSFLRRPLLLALLYPMNIELSNCSLR
jgi:hypothetical protein